MIDVMRMHEKSYWLGTVLSEISSPTAVALYGQWQQADPLAESICLLSSAVCCQPAILKTYRPLSLGQSGRNQLRGALESHYLFGLIVEHIDAASQEQRDWLVALRCWTLVTALRIARAGNVQDKLLRVVAKGIRLGCDREPAWSHLLAELAGPSDDLLELTSHLDFRAHQLRQHGGREIGSEQKKFLKALIDLAQGRADPEQPASSPRLLASIISSSENRADGIDWTFVDLPDLPIEEDVDGEEGSREVPDADWKGIVRVKRSDPKASYVQQQLSAKSVYLLDAEELHLLPWSWNKPSPLEAKPLELWIWNLLSAVEAHHRLLAAMAWVATHSGRSLKRTTALEISDVNDREWRVSTDFSCLHRLPPIRERSWVPKTADEFAWVQPVSSANKISFPHEVKRALLSAASGAPSPISLQDLWSESTSPSSAFLRLLPQNLLRITPGMLGKALPQRLFDSTFDPTFARFAASSPASGLPGACAYGNWHQITVDTCLNDGTPAQPATADEWIIGAGSRLDPLEALLVNAIRQGAAAFRQLQQQNDFIALHNGYVAFLAVSLLAATGVRPSRDPFESLRHFDFEELFCFTDEKSSGAGRSGRLVPVPKPVIKEVEQYRRYLVALAQRLSPSHPEFATAITTLTSSRASGTMPFLFMIECGEAGLTWSSVSAQSIEATSLFSWPLPMNLFRQRLAKQLRRMGVDAEIVDGLLGHAEFGCGTYADDSTRCWEADMAAVRPCLDRAYAALGFPVIAPIPVALDFSALRPAEETSCRPFGSDLRKIDRERTLANAREQAELVITTFLDGREPTALDPDQLWELSKKLLLSSNGLPLSTGYERYRVLTDKLEAAWRAEGKRAQLKRRFVRLKPPPGLFSELAPGIKAWHRQVSMAVAAISDQKFATLNKLEQRALAAVLLCVEARVANPRILIDVVCGLNYRITVLGDLHDFEYARRLDRDDPDATVERFPISPHVAAYLSHLPITTETAETDGTSARRVGMRKVGACFESLIRAIPEKERGGKDRSTYQALLTALARRVEQLNAQTLPGALSSWYSGRTPTAALGWRDRIRLKAGFAPALEYPADAGAACGTEVAMPTPVSESVSAKLDAEALQKAAHDFFAALRALMPPEEVRLKADITPTRRRDLGADVRILVKGWNGRVAPSILLLGKWIAALIEGKAGKRRSLKLSAVTRYLTALSPAFQDHAYATDLVGMDEDDVTALYAAMLESRTNQDTRYVADRLGDFHRWARDEGVEEPDWSEMPVTVTSGRRSPGLICEGEYQKALTLLLSDTTASSKLRVARAFLLLGCYRFGLRGSECFGLARNDWIEGADGSFVVLVRTHAWRTLKSPASRRQVPLLFALSDLERSIVAQMLAHVESLHGDDRSVPLFGTLDPKTMALMLVTRVKNPVIQLLKHVTGNPRITLHHARHTSANRIVAVLLTLDEAGWKAISRDGQRCGDLPELECILLGQIGPSRRQSWGVARYLGHAGTRTLWRSYLHLHDVWARQRLGPALSAPATIDMGDVIRLDNLAPLAGVDTGLLQALGQPPSNMTMGHALRFLRLIARGKSLQSAATGLALDEAQARRLWQAAVMAGTRVRVSRGKNGLPRNNEDGLAFLRRIPDRNWPRLIAWAEGCPPITDAEKTFSEHAGNGLTTVAEMAGATTQVVMWQAHHFELVRTFLTHAQLDDTLFKIRRTIGWNPGLQQLATTSRFTIVDPKLNPTRVQIDAVPSDSLAADVTRRAALLFEERATGPVRNRYEFLIALLGFCAARDGAAPAALA